MRTYRTSANLFHFQISFARYSALATNDLILPSLMSSNGSMGGTKKLAGVMCALVGHNLIAAAKFISL